MEKTINGNPVSVNEEGYLTDLKQWNKDIALEIAQEEGVGTLSPKHWEVIDYLQNQYRQNIPLTIRKIGSSGVTDIKEFYALFPGGPLKKASKIAGIPKPVSCI
ncbi:MAG TPA: TusE/DsrC/DsvC family sulfur relay protein [Flavilitoribacter sp.]|nr:TusE/DsrC/DsvC family sulfur relay protein [Lewinella sp.]MCB9277298.1 TusE/DsrC/DsvC family sulfur relay protein [Lewinellaceae bacterium]HMQ60005.1 TusE/DsrC/DsvC family sulfur relay protein [Flavilitoribacter sp.]HMQ86176.1 TusE/DsrC/DsvC family sulfur relay protein [Flavilitoribacter sp.]